MTRDPFLRLGLLAIATALFAGLIAAGLWLSVWLLLALPLGVVLAIVSTVELHPDEPDVEEPEEDENENVRVRQPADGTVGFRRLK